MDEKKLKQAFMQYLQEKSGAQTQEEFETYVSQLGEEGLRKEYAEFMKMMKLKQVSAKKFGGMLNYIKQLRGECPEGYEMQFFKQGGQICKKCTQKVKMEDGGKSPKNPVDAFKCGRKMKKKACGGDIKKDQQGGNLPTAPDAGIAYRGGTYTPRTEGAVTPSLHNNGGLQWSFPATVTAPQTTSGMFLNNPRRISEVVRYYNPNGYMESDTTYIETPEYRLFLSPNVTPRQASSTDPDRTEYETLRRRFNTAKSVSNKK